GARGRHVVAIQDLLTDIGHDLPRSTASRGFDGIFGPDTEQKVRDFQRPARLKIDGIVGRNTLAAFNAIIARRPDLDLPPIGSAALELVFAARPNGKPSWR